MTNTVSLKLEELEVVMAPVDWAFVAGVAVGIAIVGGGVIIGVGIAT